MNFKLNLAKFKKVGGDKHKTIMRHDDGHEITVAHGALSSKMRKQLQQLPAAFAEGGEVSDQKAAKSESSDQKAADDTTAILKDKIRMQLNPELQGPHQAVFSMLPAEQQYAQQVGLGNAAMGAVGGAPKAGSWMKNITAEQIESGIAKGEGYAGKLSKAVKDYIAPAAKNTGNEVEEIIKLKQAITPGNGPKPMAEGGVAEPNKSNAAAVQKGATESGWQPDRWSKNLKEGLGMADGGEVAEMPLEESMGRNPMNQVSVDPSAQAMPSPAPQQAAPPTIVINNTPSQQQPMAAVPPVGITPVQQAPSRAPAQAPQQPNDMFGNEAFNQAYSKGVGEQKQGLFNEANAISQQGEQTAKILQQQVEQQQQTARNYQDHFNVLDNERKALIDDIRNSHISTENYWKDHSKLATGIGIILAGFNPTSNPNAAIQFLNAQMDRNLQAQRADLGKKESLLSANMRQFGNMRDANDMTRVMQMDMVSNMLKQQAAQSTSPLAKANALKAAGQLDMQAAPIMSQIAMRRTLVSGMQNNQIAPDKVVNFVVPEHQRAEANKELQTAQNMTASKDNLMTVFDQVAKLNTAGNRITSPLQSRSKIQALLDPAIAQLAKDSAGKFTEADAGALAALFPSMTDNEETLALKRNQLNKFVSEKMHFPVLSTYGIDVSKLGRYNNQGSSNIKESAPIIK